MKHTHPHPRWFRIAWSLSVLTFIAGAFSASFFLTAYLFDLTNFFPPALLVQILNSVLGLMLAGLVAGSISKVVAARGWQPERTVFKPILDALERISKGDFSVRLESSSEDNRMVNALTSSVNKMALELEQMENLRQEFISNVSHEIQSPLTSIRGSAQALQNDSLSAAERHHYLAIIEAESTRLSRITEGLLKLAALDAEEAVVAPKPYRLDRQIRELILACEPQWAAKDLEMNVNLEAVEITADEDLLSQVWTNLLNNSIKFTPQGGQVRVDLRRLVGKIEFQICDTGIGISPEDQTRIFERFYKADPARTRANGSCGLGLAIAKKIVDMHRGEITVASSPGSGTTFTVRLK